MKNNFRTLFIFPFSILLLSFIGIKQERTVKDFHLLNVDGNLISLSDYPDAKGFIIVFTCNHCPFAKLYPDRLNKLNSKYKIMGVPLIAISSTDTVIFDEDTYARMIEKSKSDNFNYPYLFDEFQTAAKYFGAQKTPHAFVIWRENGTFVVKYNGAIDDNGAEPDKVINHYVDNAVDDLLNGKEVKLFETNSIGCQIKFRN